MMRAMTSGMSASYESIHLVTVVVDGMEAMLSVQLVEEKFEIPCRTDDRGRAHDAQDLSRRYTSRAK